MSTARLLQTYGVSLVAFLALDALWLGIVARAFYRDQLGPLLTPDVRWGAALLFYVIFVAGVLVFAVLPAVERGSLGRAVLLGGFFGVVTYAAVGAAVDMVWGGVLTATVATIGYLFATRGPA